MNKFSNPLDNIKIASPCPANWNEMIGNGRKRYCSECKLNVYNLSDMTRREAENFIINAEGRVCVKFYRRSDGSILTKDCPVGWQAVKRKVSRTAKAFVSLCAGIFGGIFAFNQFQPSENIQNENLLKVSEIGQTVPLNKTVDFEQIPSLSVSNDKHISDGPYVEIVGGMKLIRIEKVNKKSDRKNFSSKKPRRR